MEAKPRNTISTNSGESPDARKNAARWPAYMRRALLSLALVTCATAAIQAHDSYSELFNKDGKRCCNKSDCAILPPSTVKAKLETPELVGRFVRLDGGAPLVRRISSGGETFATQDFPVRVTQDGRIDICLRPDPEGELGVTCLLFSYSSPGGP
jgi:hypothetical protein